jgi:hypothetical protein
VRARCDGEKPLLTSSRCYDCRRSTRTGQASSHPSMGARLSEVVIFFFPLWSFVDPGCLTVGSHFPFPGPISANLPREIILVCGKRDEPDSLRCGETSGSDNRELIWLAAASFSFQSLC